MYRMEKKHSYNAHACSVLPTLCDPMDCKFTLSMEFSRQKYGVGCHFLFQDVFPTQLWDQPHNSLFPALEVDSFTTVPPRKQLKPKEVERVEDKNKNN